MALMKSPWMISNGYYKERKSAYLEERKGLYEKSTRRNPGIETFPVFSRVSNEKNAWDMLKVGIKGFGGVL